MKGKQKDTEWLTYERIGHGSFTRRADEKRQTKHSYGWEPRPATKAEIAAELERRKVSDAEKAKQAEFEVRQDYQDAKAIANLLEWITPESHPLDRLKPEEWAELRRRLQA